MRTQNSKIGRPRKVLRQANVQLSFNGKHVTAHAGMALVARAMEAFGLRAQLTSIVADLDRGRQHDTTRMLEQLVALRLVGGEAISDLRRLQEPALSALFDWEAVAHGGTFSRRLKDFTWRHNLGLQEVVRDLYRRLAPSGPRLWAIDSTVEPVFGEPEGAARGYNPHKPGRLSYHPLLAVDVEARAVVDGYLRPGSAASGDGLEGFVRTLVAEAPGAPEDLVFRLDKGLCAGPVLDTLEKLHCGYVAKFKLTQRVVGRISTIKKWRSLGQGIFAANFRYQPRGWSRPRRFVVIERNEPASQTPPSGQLPLFELLEGRLEVICTNQRLNAANVWRLYNRGAVVEQVIEELKNDLAATDIRTDRFWANDTLFLTGLIAYNLLNALRRLALPKAYRAARLKRVSFMFLTLGANVVRHARGLWIKLGRDYPLRLIFYRAWAALTPS